MMSKRRKEFSRETIWGWVLAGVAIAIYVSAVRFGSGSFEQLIIPEHLRNMILLVGGIVGLAIAAKRARAADNQAKAAHEQAEQQSRQVENVSRQIGISEQGHITERFTRAIEQLGSDKLFLRLSAIAALERIGRDSNDSTDDVLAVLSLLSGFVRENTSIEKTDDIKVAASPMPLDILESILALSRLARQYRTFLEENGLYIQLWKTQLSGPHPPLSNAYFGRFNFSGASLLGKTFFNSDCHDTKFIKANLDHAMFENLSLEGADFSGAKLNTVLFNEVDMKNVCLDYAHCNVTIFQNPKNMTTEMVSKILYSKGQSPRGVPKDVELPPPTPLS